MAAEGKKMTSLWDLCIFRTKSIDGEVEIVFRSERPGNEAAARVDYQEELGMELAIYGMLIDVQSTRRLSIERFIPPINRDRS